MNFKLKFFICVITTFLFACSAVEVSWSPSPTPTVTGYKIYWGTNSDRYDYNIDVGNVTNTTLINSNYIVNVPYYFSSKAYDTNQDSAFSPQVIWTNLLTIPNEPLNITYVGVKVDYGVSIVSINSKQVMVMSVTNQPGYFYNQSLIITNNPFVGTRPRDDNSYIYIGTTIQYGKSLITLKSETFPLITFTNPPGYYYRSSLILTNNPF